jgi:outer membrane protein assembly factor BamA
VRRDPLFAGFALGVFLTTLLHADCRKNDDHRSNKNSGLLITDFIISGTQKLSSAELTRLEGHLTGSCFDENLEELEERVRALFQDRGYFGVVVKSFRVKPGDPLLLPKPVTLEVEVLEGTRYRLAEITFTGNHTFSAAKLRSTFPLSKGDLFGRDKIAGGLDSLRSLYAADGFIDLTMIPDTENSSDSTINLAVTVIEGPQYRMGKLEILAKKEIADRLQAEWRLPEGAVFDLTYVDKYIGENRSLLPLGFARDGVQLVRNCPDALVEVRLPLDAGLASQSQPKEVECEPSHDGSK